MRTAAIAFIFAVGLTSAACSTNPGDVTPDTGVADAADAAELFDADTGKSPHDTGDRTGADADAQSGDIADSSDGREVSDSGDVDRQQLAAGESCQSECGRTENGGPKSCEICEGDQCYTPFEGEAYCTRPCGNDSDCEELGQDWECGGLGDTDVCIIR